MTFLSKLLPAAILTIAVFAAIPSQATTSHHKQGPAYSVIQSTGIPPTPNPPTPKKVTFAGETHDMDRLDKYERLDREITQMTYSHASTLLMLKRANRVFPVIAPILKANGVPTDLVYLAAIAKFSGKASVQAAASMLHRRSEYYHRGPKAAAATIRKMHAPK